MSNKPIMIREVIKEIEYIDSELDGKTIKEVIKYFSQWPLDAKLDIAATSYYDSASVGASVYRMRLENTQEQAKRIRINSLNDSRLENQRRNKYEELKKEFEGEL